MDKNHIAVRLYLCFAMAISMVSAQIQGNEGGAMRITCSVAGTLPRWTKDASIIFTSEGNSMINPAYSTRFSYDADQKTLIVNPVELSDAGRYVCLIGGILGTDVVVSVITTTSNVAPTSTVPASTEVITPNNTQGSSKQKGFSKTTMIIIITCSCCVAVIVVIIVLVLIRRKKKQIEQKFPNKNGTFQNKTVMSQNENVMFSNEAQNEPVNQSISTPGLQG